MSIGSRVKQARKLAGITQEELAREADLSLPAVARLERDGITDPHFSTLAKLARALGVTVSTLAGEEVEGLPKAPAPSESGQSEVGAEMIKRVNRLPVEARQILLNNLDSLEHE